MYFFGKNILSRVCLVVVFSSVNVATTTNASEPTPKEHPVKKKHSVKIVHRWHGEIMEIGTVKVQHKELVTFQFASGGEVKNVWLAPPSYLGNLFSVGETIDIEGTAERENNLQKIVAFRVIKSDGTIVSCRGENGKPIWTKHRKIGG